MSHKLLVVGVKVDSKIAGKVRHMHYNDRECLSIVCMNLLSCADGKTILLYSRDTGGMTMEQRTNKKAISGYRIVKAIDWLEQESYVLSTKASAYQLFNENKNLSYIVPTQKFIDKFDSPGMQEKAIKSMRENMQVLVLRKDGKNTKYRQTKKMQEYEQAMHNMNNNNALFNVLSAERTKLETNYWRLFLDHIESNGRMYTVGIHNVENKIAKGRLKITIDESSIVEIDFNAVHIRILAARHGVEMPESDAYIWMLPDDMKTLANRKVIKMSVVRLLNCPSRASAMITFRDALEASEGHSFDGPAHVMRTIEEALPSLVKEFYKDKLGLSLTYTESCIMADVVAMFVSLRKPIFPVHDSAVVKAEDKELLAVTMADYFRKHTNTTRKAIIECTQIIDGVVIKTDCSN